MEPFSKQVLDLVPPFPGKDRVECYAGDRLAIFKPKILFAGEHCLPFYHFAMPFSPMPRVIVGNKPYSLEINKMFPFNADQCFRGENEDTMLVDGYLVLFIEKEFLEEIAHSIYRKSDLCFRNVGFSLDWDMQNQLRSFMKESFNGQQGSDFILEGITLQLVVNFLRKTPSNLPVEKTPPKCLEKTNIHRTIDFLWENYHSNYTLKDVADQANLSPHHFIKVFKAETGLTPFEYLLHVKIERAKEMLEYKDFSITEVCFKSGFQNVSHFSAAFKKKTGASPSEFRKAIRGG